MSSILRKFDYNFNESLKNKFLLELREKENKILLNLRFVDVFFIYR